ncbi:MAG: hypothetical protein LBI63_04535 [Candidatus Ancillula sp.]|jgi:primosomal protein N' (replication factor Y)|nr:hypothetical protein [Candidatus Ancillula sp.]
MSSVFLRVAVLGAPMHLGELFDYLPPKQFDQNLDMPYNGITQVENSIENTNDVVSLSHLYGHIVEVKFGNRNMRGVVIEVVDKTDFVGKLKHVEKIVSKYPVITQKMQKYYEEIARYYGTRLANILEIAIPNWNKLGENDYEMHLTRKSEDLVVCTHDELHDDSSLKTPISNEKLFENYSNYGICERFALCIAPVMIYDENNPDANTPAWIYMMANMMANMHLDGKSVLLVVPTEQDLDLLTLEFSKFVNKMHFVSLSSANSARNRYLNYLRILNHEVRIVLGTRLASLAPLETVDVCIILHDLNSLHKDMRAPYIHSREVLLNRRSKGLIIASYTRSPTAQRLVEIGYLQDVFPTRQYLRKIMAHIEVVQKDLGARIPQRASYTIRCALELGPVLILSPITGYVQLIACNNCAQIARCDDCSGSLRSVEDQKYLICSKCSKIFNNWTCLNCHKNKLRFLRIGNSRLVEEVGKLFPGVVVRNSSSKAHGGIIRNVDNAPQIIISTPGAEPIPARGYSAVVILDANYWVDLTSLDGIEDTLLLWFYAISLVAPTTDSRSSENGSKSKVVVIGSIPSQLQNAVIRLDPRLVMSRELKMRRINELPPFARCAVVVGQSSALEQLVKHVDINAIDGQLLGPFKLEETSYYRSLEEWSKKIQNSDANPPQCLIIKVDVSNGRKLAASILSAYIKVYTMSRLHSGFRLRIGDIKILMDPKELL